MRPRMDQYIYLSRPLIDVITGKPLQDKHGRPRTENITSHARVRSSDNLIRTADGTEHDTNIEIDVPAFLVVNAGEVVEYQMIDGRMGKGKVVDSKESVNLAGNRIWFRTVFVDGQ